MELKGQPRVIRKTKVGIERIQREAKTRKVWKGAVSRRSPMKVPQCIRNVPSKDDGAMSGDEDVAWRLEENR